MIVASQQIKNSLFSKNCIWTFCSIFLLILFFGSCGKKELWINALVIQLGQIEPNSVHTVEIEIKNSDYAVPLYLKFQPSCSCTILHTTEERIDPKRSLKIPVVFTARNSKGFFDEEIKIYYDTNKNTVNKNNENVKILHVQGEVYESVTAIPRSIVVSKEKNVTDSSIQFKIENKTNKEMVLSSSEIIFDPTALTKFTNKKEVFNVVLSNNRLDSHQMLGVLNVKLDRINAFPVFGKLQISIKRDNKDFLVNIPVLILQKKICFYSVQTRYY